MGKLKLYTFIDLNGEIIDQVRAYSHSGAIDGTWPENGIDSLTQFYSDPIDLTLRISVIHII